MTTTSKQRAAKIPAAKHLAILELLGPEAPIVRTRDFPFPPAYNAPGGKKVSESNVIELVSAGWVSPIMRDDVGDLVEYFITPTGERALADHAARKAQRGRSPRSHK